MFQALRDHCFRDKPCKTMVVTLVAFGCAVAAGVGCRRGWRHDSHPMQLPAVDAELFFVQEPSLARAGPDRLAIVRVGNGATFVAHTYQGEGLTGPMHIEEWAKKLGAPVVFNAGQFDQKMHHLGWLKGAGAWLEPGRKSSFKGLFVSGPMGGASPAGGQLPWSQIVDLAHDDAGVATLYDNVIQSMMLIDQSAQVRVRESELSACRTVLAQDDQGRMLVIVSEGAVTLHDFAEWLPHSGLHIVRAMNLDGGAESQMAIHTGATQVALFGKYGHERLLTIRPSVAEAPLPAVIAIVPR